MFIECETQEEIDRFWNAFADGGEESQIETLKKATK